MFEIIHYAYKKDLPVAADTIYHPNLVSSGYGLIEASLSVELNLAGTLEMQIPITHPRYTIFDLRTSECAVLQDGEEIWRGFVSEESVDFDGTKTVVCTGIQAYLNDSIVNVPKGTKSADALLTYLINNHNSKMTVDDDEEGFTRPMANKTFVKGTVDVEGDIIFEDASGYDLTWNIIETNLINELGGYISVHRDLTTDKNVISYTQESGETDTDYTQTIEYGINLLDLNITVNTEELFTVLVATAQSVDDNENTIELDPMVNTDAAELYGYIWQTFSLEKTDAESDSELEEILAEECSKKLAKAGVATSLEGKALDWHNVDVDVAAIKLGDKNLIYSHPNGLNGTVAYRCSKIDYDLLYFEQSDYSFGENETTMTAESIKDINKVKEELERRAKDAEERIDEAISESPFYIYYNLDASSKMTSDQTVRSLVNAMDSGRQLIAMDLSNGNYYYAQAVKSVSSGLYTITLTIQALNSSWSGTGLSIGDTLELLLVTP